MKIFITGVSFGIGRELAKQFVAAGHMVWGMARRRELLDALDAELGNKLLRVSLCDLSNLVEIKNLAQEMEQENFCPDILLLNAAVFLTDLDQGLNYEKARYTMEVNVSGSLFWISQLLPKFLQKKDGLILGISSTSSLRPTRGDLSYSASKAALAMIFRGLHLNCANSGVRFIAVNFGPIDTKMWPGKRLFLVPKAGQAARFIVKLINKPSGVYYYPFWSTFFFRLLGFVPDRFFSFINSLLK